MKLTAHLLAAILCWTITVDKPVNTIDGDTFVVLAPIWHDMTVKERVRVLDIDTPELHGEDKERGEQAKLFTTDWLNRGPFEITTCRRDAFGRLLAVVSRNREVLADELRAAGHTKK